MSSNEEQGLTVGVVPAAQLDVNELVKALLEQNRLREQQMDAILSKLIDNKPEVPVTTTMLPTIMQTIPKFNGESGDTDVASEWLNALNTAAVLNKWPDACTLEAGRSQLEGAAKQWYLSHMDQLDTVSKFTAAFRAMFTSRESVTETWKKMSERVQQRDETVFAYFHEKVRMCRRLQLSAAETKKMICIGLHSREMSTALLSNGHVDEAELLTDIRTYMEVEANRSERFSSGVNHKKRNISSGSASKVTATSHKEENVSTTANVERRVKEGPRCYNCQLYGHIARDCTQPRKPMHCKKCGKDGHTSKYCKASVPEVNVVCTQTKGQLTCYIKEVRINEHDKPVKGLIDTGSAYSILKKSIAVRYGLHVEPKKVSMLVYGNTQSVESCGETWATVSIDQVSERIPLIVVDDRMQNYDIIIGRTFTECNEVTFIKTNEQLRFAYGMRFPYHDSDVPQNDLQVYNARIIQSSEKLPASSAKLIGVVAGNHQLEVMIINDSTKEVELQHGAQVGTICMNNIIPHIGNNDPVNQITAEQVNIGPMLTETEVCTLLELLNSYRMCFAFNLKELGCTDIIQMDIVDTGQPVVSRPYRASATERETISRIVKEWKDVGIVTETNSPYASPVLLVTKKDGDARLVVDYRKLNAQTVRKVFPTPNLDDHLESLYEAKLFSTLDLASGYLQVPLTESAKEKTAFVTPNESGQFERMVFGLINAPYEFSRLMQKIMSPLRDKVAMWYLDDILIPSTTSDDMFKRLKQVLEVLKEAKLTLKLSKCYFAYSEVVYLGYTLSADGVRPGEQKVQAIQQYPRPRNKHEVRRFLGLCGFFRRFIPHYSDIARPISELLKEKIPYMWTTAQEEAFKTMKEKLVSRPVLQLYNPKAHTEVHCDASSEGLSGMLLQRNRDGDNQLHLVQAVSKKTTPEERNYHSSKLELMAVVWSLSKLRHYLIGINFVIITDCQAIVHLNTQKTVNPQVARWATLLSEYNYDIKHRPGVKMAHIDALSRAPVNGPEDTDTEQLDERCGVFMTITEEEQVAAMQRTDTRLNEIAEILSRKETGRTAADNAKVKGYLLNKGLVYRRVMDGDEEKHLWVVPDSMRKSIVVRFHDLAGHFSLDRTVMKIMERYYFPGMRRYVKYHIQCCPECVLTKTPRGKQPGQLHPIMPGRRPFEIINLDHIGPFVRSTRGNCYVLVLIDNLTKFVKLFPVKSCNTEGVTRSLEQFIISYGIPKRIISDRGTAFTSRTFEEFCVQHGIRHTLNSVRHPQANGQVERVNSTLVPVMQANMETDRTWDKHITIVESQLNNAYNKTIGHTPFQVLFGYLPSFKDGVLRHTTTTERWEAVDQLRSKVRERIVAEHHIWKERYDPKHSQPVLYQVGEVVFIRKPPDVTGESTKLQSRYRGPLVITEVLPNDVYKVTSMQNEGGRRYATTVHVSHIKGYHLPETEGEKELPYEGEQNTSDEVDYAGEEVNEQPGRRSGRQRRLPQKLKDCIY